MVVAPPGILRADSAGGRPAEPPDKSKEPAAQTPAGLCGRPTIAAAQYRTPFRGITYPRTMHGTLPFSEQQALASLRGGTAGRKSIALLAREWGWSRDTVRRRLESWRHNGDLTAEQVRPQRRTAMPMRAA